MDKTYLPGTKLVVADEAIDNLTDILTPIFRATKGIMLSQIKEITGLETSTLQNWVKRGWVEKPVGKKYNEEQVARILIINILRDSLQLEKIVQLLEYINGDILNEYDNIIKESTLYGYLIKVITKLQGKADRKTVAQKVDQVMADYEYHGPIENSAQRLRTALNIMALAVVATRFKTQANALLDRALAAAAQALPEPTENKA